MKANKLYFPNLDGLRTVAFLIVFFGHCFFLFDYKPGMPMLKVLITLFTHADLGVNFFFVLSGFLISYLLLAEKHKNGKINIQTFYIRRVLRIWPVYFMVILLALALSLIPFLSFSLSNVRFGLVATFLTNIDLVYYNISSVPISVLWSVAVEEQFYLVLPLLILCFGKKVFKAFPLFIVLSFFFRLYHYGNSNIMLYHTFSVASALFVGCILAYLALETRFIEWLNRLPKSVISIVYLFLVLAIVLRRGWFGGAFGTSIDSLVFSILFGFVIVEQNYCQHSFYKMKNLKILTGLGKYTYGLYAYHIIFICLIEGYYFKFFGQMNNPLVYVGLYILALASSILFAMASYHLMETPFLKLKEKFSPK